MMRKHIRYLSLLFCLTFALSSCTIVPDLPETSATSATTESLFETEETTEETVEEPQEPELSPEEIREKALETASYVGVDEEDLREKYELFLKFAHCVEINPDLGYYKSYVYQLFPIVADHLESEDEESFLEKLRTLVIDDGLSGPGASAYYLFPQNVVLIGGSIDNGGGDGTYALSIFHELIHFLDYAMDGEICGIFYMNDGRIVDPPDLVAGEEDKISETIYADAFVEGGAEYYVTKYYSNAPLAYSYCGGTSFLTAIEYIYGPEKVDELFFHHDTTSRLADLLVENGFSNEETVKIIKTMNMLVYEYVYDPDELIDPQVALIRLYQNAIGEDYEDDANFMEILSSVRNEKLDEIFSGDHLTCTRRNDEINNQVSWKLFDDIYADGVEFCYWSDPIPFFIDGELKYTVLASRYVGGSRGHDIPVICDYDRATNTVSNIEFLEGNWGVPKYLDNYYSDEAYGAQDLIDSLKVDNSAAYSQTVTGNNSGLSDLYSRAEEIGRKYGVYIWFDDLVPDDFKIYSTPATDHNKISDALDKIDEVLSLYPAGYFDQLLFEYYSGFVICLYDGDYDIMLHHTAYIGEDNYMAVFINIGETELMGTMGIEDLRQEHFPCVDVVSGQLIVGIWDCTERFISHYNDHFIETTVNEDTWMATNDPSFAYVEVDSFELINDCYASCNSSYMLTEYSVASPKIDRLLIYEYIMFSALFAKNNDPMPPPLTIECRAKADELNRAIRDIFDTSSWPSKTSWEQVDI